MDPEIQTHGNITYQRQPTNRTCAHTCIAMVLGVPVQQVIDYYTDQAMGQLEIHKALSECRVLWNGFIHGSLVTSGWYMMTVPSLNKRGGLHCILYHWDDETGRSVLFDPALGERYEQTGRDLLSWSDLILFKPGGQLPQKRKGAE